MLMVNISSLIVFTLGWILTDLVRVCFVICFDSICNSLG